MSLIVVKSNVRVFCTLTLLYSDLSVICQRCQLLETMQILDVSLCPRAANFSLTFDNCSNSLNWVNATTSYLCSPTTTTVVCEHAHSAITTISVSMIPLTNSTNIPNDGINFGVIVQWFVYSIILIILQIIKKHIVSYDTSSTSSYEMKIISCTPSCLTQFHSLELSDTTQLAIHLICKLISKQLFYSHQFQIVDLTLQQQSQLPRSNHALHSPKITTNSIGQQHYTHSLLNQSFDMDCNQSISRLASIATLTTSTAAITSTSHHHSIDIDSDINVDKCVLFANEQFFGAPKCHEEFQYR